MLKNSSHGNISLCALVYKNLVLFEDILLVSLVAGHQQDDAVIRH